MSELRTMTEYEYDSKQFHPADGETVEIPENAIGVSVTSFGDPRREPEAVVSVRYLKPK